MFEPTNEQGVIALFCMMIHESPWKIKSIRTDFPDAILIKNGEEWRVEFEFAARNFINHAHDFRGCDIIICWKNDFDECPLPVLELCDTKWITCNPQKGNPMQAQVEYWRNRAIKAEKRLERATKDIQKPVAFKKLDMHSMQMKMISIYEVNPTISDEKMAAEIGKSKKTIQDALSDLVAKEVVEVEKVGRGKSVSVNGKYPQFVAEVNA